MLRQETVKLIETAKFSLELIRTEDDHYILSHENRHNNVVTQSARIQNFKTASFLFEAKMQELEGN